MDLTTINDAELFAQAREGDRNALACLVDRHKDSLVNYLTRLSGSRDRAEDLAQETFLRLVERSGGYREQGKLLAYLYRIATNLLRSQERTERRRRFLKPLLVYSAGRHDPPAQDRRVLRRELADELTAALAALPSHYREPIVLRDIEDWSYREIAVFLDCREGTVKSRIHRGRDMLREQLEPRWQGAIA